MTEERSGLEWLGDNLSAQPCRVLLADGRTVTIAQF